MEILINTAIMCASIEHTLGNDMNAPNKCPVTQITDIAVKIGAEER